MILIATRRLRACLLTGLAAALLALIFLAYSFALRDISYLSGWTLFAMLVLLMLFNLRKKLPYPPLFSAAAWLQLHVYVGVLSLFVFAFHLSGWPDSGFEWLLALLFCALIVSGLLGLALSRMLPRRLTLLGEEVIYERIPAHCRELREQLEQRVLQAAASSAQSVLPDFYAQLLAHHFQTQGTMKGLMGSRRRGKALVHALRARRRYMNVDECAISEELADLIEARTILDQHALWQGWLKLWLFVHIPLSASLMVFVLLHVLVVYAYSAGIQ